MHPVSSNTRSLVNANRCNPPADPDDMHRGNSSHGNSMIITPSGTVLDEATSFEERLVVGQLEMKAATGSHLTDSIILL